MKKLSFILILLLFMFISSVSASEINITDHDVCSISENSEVIEISNDESNLVYIDESANNNFKNDTNTLGVNSNDNQLSSASDLIENPDFDQWEDNVPVGWTPSGTVYQGSDDEHDYYVQLEASKSSSASITQSIDWTNIEELYFDYKNPSSQIVKVTIKIGDVDFSSALSNVNKGTGWDTINPIDVSGINEEAILTITATGTSNRANSILALDSFKYTLKSNEEDEDVNGTFNGYVNSPIKFNYTTTENITRWEWNFGNGTFSTNPTPVYYYSEPGKYKVNLTITNESEDKNVSFLVNVIEKPIANFTQKFYTDTKRFILTDTSSGSITNWTVDFGDNYITPTPTVQEDNLIMFQHTYSSYGVFNVTLTVTDILGTNSSITKYGIVNIEPVTVTYSVAYPVEVNSFENSTDGWTLSDGATLSTDIHHDGEYSVYMNDAGYIEKIINFDEIDSIEYYLYNNGANSGLRGHLYINGNEVNCIDVQKNAWGHGSYNTKNLVGYNTVKLYAPKGTGYIDQITFKSTSYNLANFSSTITNIGDEITVSFTDMSYGVFNGWLWNFGDGNTSTSRNPTYTFKTGTYQVTLTTYYDDFKLNTVTKYLNLSSLPTVVSTGNMYSTIQEAINAAGDNDIVNIYDIDYTFTENLLINKSLTLNFNGAILNAEDTALPLINVTNGATVTVTNIGLGKDSTVITDDTSKLIITGSDIGVDLTLNKGNIDLIDNVFTNSYLTVNANTTIANSTVSKGGVIVSDGKSRIFNTTLSGCDVAIAQNNGELEITSNLITDNAIGINVTDGKTLLKYNIIYNNAEYGLVYNNSDITNTYNWWGSENPDNDIYHYGEGFDIESLLFLNITSDKIMGYDKEYIVDVALVCDDGFEIEGYLKTITLDFTSSSADIGSVILENGVGQTTLLTTVTQADSITLITLDKEYALDSRIVSSTDVILSRDGDESVGGSVTISARVDYATGNVTFIVDSQEYLRELTDGVANYTINDLTSGLHTVMVVYGGNDILSSVYNTTSFTVSSEGTDVSVIIDGVEYPAVYTNNGNVTVKANITAINSNNVSVVIDGVEYLAELNNGSIVVKNKVVNNLTDTSLSVSDLKLQVGNTGTLQVTIKDTNNAIANKTITVFINGVGYTGVSDVNGVAKISIPKFTSAGTYNAVVSFAGDDDYKSSLSTGKIIVSKKATKLTAPKKTFKVKTKTKKIKITLKTGKTAIKGKKLTLKVNKKTYTAKTNKKGVATFKIKKLTKKGTFKYTVKFKGDQTYKAISKKGTIKVKK